MKILFTAPAYVSNQLHYDFLVETLDSIKTKYDHKVVLVENYILQDNNSYKDLVMSKSDVLLSNPHGNNVSGAWNEGIKFGIENKFDYIFVINLDIIFHKNAIDTLIDFAENNKQYDLYTCAEWTDRRSINTLTINQDPNNKDMLLVDGGNEVHHWEKEDIHPHFSCFMIRPETISKLAKFEEGTAEPIYGLFDVGYKNAYFEDNDYHQRLLRANMKAVKCNSAIFYHYGSRTIKSDEVLEIANVRSYEANREYLKSKFNIDVHGKVLTDEERMEQSFKTAFNIPRK